MATNPGPWICVTCEDSIPADGPAVGLWKSGFGLFSGEVWIPRIDTMAPADMHLMHTVCFSNERGTDALDDLMSDADQEGRH